MKFDVYTDGGSRGNPGNCASGFIIFQNSQLVDFGAEYLGVGTNNQAEYSAVLLALRYLRRKYSQSELVFHLDSELAVKQLNLEYKVRNPELKKIFLKIKTIEESFAQVEYKHVGREENKFADKLVNIALDAVEAK
jgi:ribonuclease HI